MKRVNLVFILSISTIFLSASIFAQKNESDGLENSFVGMLKSEFTERYAPDFFETEPQAYSLNDPPRPTIVKIAPKYPEKAASRNKTGIVLVGYRILPDGSVSEVEIIEEVPKGFGLGREGVKAAKNFVYAEIDESTKAKDDIVYSINRFTFSLEPGGGTKRELNKLINEVNSGDAKSMYDMATLANAVFRIKLEPAKKNELILKSAMLDYHPAQLNLGLKLFSGHGVNKDRMKSKHWLELSALNGNAFAKIFLEKRASSFLQTSNQISHALDSIPAVQE